MSEDLRFVRHALGARKRLVAALLATVVSAAAALVAVLPRTYRVEARLLARSDPVLPALANPQRTVPRDDPARSAADLVTKRSNLLRLIDETRLMDTWSAGRGPLLPLADRALEALVGPSSPEERGEALVDLLEKRLYVRADEGTVVIGVEWSDGPTARAIVEAAQRRFLEERRATELATIEESIAILERHVSRARPARLMYAALPWAVGGTPPALHEELTRRLWDARIELDSMRTTFDRRYRVVEPARTPAKPEAPELGAVLLASVMAGLLLGAFAATAAGLRAGEIHRTAPTRWSLAGLLLASLTVATVGAVVAGQGRIAVAVAPVVGVSVLYALAKAPARTSALVLLFMVLALENPGDAGGRWRSPLSPLGALLLANLNLSLPIRALRFTGLDVLMSLLLVVILVRRALRSPVDRAESPSAGPMTAAAAVWLGTLLTSWAYGLARGGDFRNSLWQCHQLLWLPLAYFAFRSALRGPRDDRALAGVVVAAACVKAGLALWVRMAVSASPHVLPTATSHGDSVLFGCAFSLVAALVVEQAIPRRAVAAGLVLALLAAGMIANNQRLAWVEVGAALAAMSVAASATRLKRAVARAAGLALPVLLVYGAVGWTSASAAFKPVRLVRSLVESRADASTAMRDIENFNLLWTLRDRPLLGTGFGHPYVEKVKGMDISGIFAQYRFVPHNGVLGLLAFGGVVGLSGIFLALVVAVFLAARTHLFARSPAERAAALAVIAVVVVYLVQCYGDMGFVSWTGVFTLAPALAVAGRLAVATGAWPDPDSGRPAVEGAEAISAGR